MKAALFVALLLACAHSSETVIDSASREIGVSSHDATTDKAREIEQKKEQSFKAGPVDVDETTITGELVYFDNPPSGAARHGAGPVRFQGLPPGVMFEGPVTIKARKEHFGETSGSSSSDTKEKDQESLKVNDKGATEKDKAGETKNKNEGHPALPTVNCGFGGTVWGLVAFLAVAGIIAGGLFLAKKFSKWPFGPIP